MASICPKTWLASDGSVPALLNTETDLVKVREPVIHQLQIGFPRRINSLIINSINNSDNLGVKASFKPVPGHGQGAFCKSPFLNTTIRPNYRRSLPNVKGGKSNFTEMNV